MVDSTNQKKSPFILLLLLSLLVIATLVVASLYFVRPNLEAELEQRVSQNIEKIGVNTNVNVAVNETKVDVIVTGRDAIITGEVEPLAVAKKVEQVAKDTCGIRFIDNQLLVKNHN